MKRIISLVMAFVLILSCFVLNANAAKKMPTLSFGKDGKFRILHLTDMQDDQYPAKELQSFIKKAVENTDPDLVVITGDLVENSRTGDRLTDKEAAREGVTVEGDYKATLKNVKAAVDAIFAPLEELGVYYVVTQGNNDYSSGIKNSDWLKIYSAYPHCITFDKSNDKAGKIDNYIEIYKYKSKKAGYGLWLLDNGSGFTSEQATWMKNKKTSNVPSIVFEHVPVPEVGNLFVKCHIWSRYALLDRGFTGLYRLNHEVASGISYMSYPPTGTMSDTYKMWKSKGVKAAFFGHIHTDGYTGEYEGITLGLTFGCQFAKGKPYGYRVIDLNQNGSFETELFTYEKGEFSPLENKVAVPKRGIILNLVMAVYNIALYPFMQANVLFKQL